MQNKILHIILALLFFCVCETTAAAMQSENYLIPNSVFSGGGSPVNSENYEIDSTLGQPTPLNGSTLSPPTSSNYKHGPGFWYVEFELTLIELSSFTVTPSDREVIFEWTTESEIDNAGFNLYRAESADGEYLKINSSLIPAEGNGTSGATYQYIDNDVKNRTTYYYKLEDIDLNGTSTMHGPVSAVPRRLGRD
jgi:hypothetical protein